MIRTGGCRLSEKDHASLKIPERDQPKAIAL
jgi:hypothetical protein